MFSGFDRKAPAFWHELAAEMNRDWFLANKERYETQWVQPMQELLTQTSAKLAKAYAPLKLGPPRVMRIYRDTRFSKDKAPYKTHISGVVSVAGKARGEGCTALYVHLGVDEEFIGVGTYFFDPKQLPKWRKLVAADKTGVPLAQLVNKLRKAGYPVGGHDDYKRVPKPYDEDHPRAEFLKMKGLTAGLPDMPRGMLHRPQLVDWLAKSAAPTAPMVKWLYQNMR